MTYDRLWTQLQWKTPKRIWLHSSSESAFCCYCGARYCCSPSINRVAVEAITAVINKMCRINPLLENSSTTLPCNLSQMDKGINYKCSQVASIIQSCLDALELSVADVGEILARQNTTCLIMVISFGGHLSLPKPYILTYLFDCKLNHSRWCINSMIIADLFVAGSNLPSEIT